MSKFWLYLLTGFAFFLDWQFRSHFSFVLAAYVNMKHHITPLQASHSQFDNGWCNTKFHELVALHLVKEKYVKFFRCTFNMLLIGLIELMHLKIARNGTVKGDGWLNNQGRVKRSFGLHQRGCPTESGVDSASNLLAQIVGLKSVTKFQNV